MIPEIKTGVKWESVPPRSQLDAGLHLMSVAHRGGRVTYLWTDNGRLSLWYEIDGPRPVLPAMFRNSNLYWAVNPLNVIPPCNKTGNTDRRYIAATDENVIGINLVSADFDGKDEVASSEYAPYLPANIDELNEKQQREERKAARERRFYAEPELFKARAWRRLADAPLAPSIIVDSGGGYQAYWFFTCTVFIDDSNRASVQRTLSAWVKLIGADPGVCDLRRVLRVPGSRNHKPGFGSHPPKVVIVHYDPSVTYVFETVERLADAWLTANSSPSAPPVVARRRAENCPGGSVYDLFNKSFSVVEILESHGYTVLQRGRITRLARPGKREPSVTVMPANGERPEMAVAHSSNDDLHPANTGRRSRGLDAFGVVAVLDHGGNNKVAFISAKQALGQWR